MAREEAEAWLLTTRDRFLTVRLKMSITRPWLSTPLRTRLARAERQLEDAARESCPLELVGRGFVREGVQVEQSDGEGTRGS